MAPENGSQDPAAGRYQRAHQDLTQPATLGIGLSVARQLARLMGGDLAYRGEATWTVFDLQLPTAAVTPSDGTTPQTQHPEPAHRPPTTIQASRVSAGRTTGP
jgi:hypothetical protein